MKGLLPIITGISAQSLQLNEMMNQFNPAFAQKTHEYFNYGCNCFLEGNWGEMNSAGHGTPIDPLDATCSSYKTCLAVVAANYGPNCKPENVNYRSNGASCGGDANTCQRAVCECDAEFAAAHAKNVNFFKSEYYTLSYLGKEDQQCAWIPTAHCRAKMPGALPKKPCHPVTYKNYNAYHYDNDYQGALTQCSTKGQYLIPYDLSNGDAASILSILATQYSEQDMVQIWLPYESPPETAGWFNFYSANSTFNPEASPLWACGERLATEKLPAAELTGACLIFLQNNKAAMSDECKYGYYMAPCKSKTTAETVCSDTKSGSVPRGADPPTIAPPTNSTKAVNTYEDCNAGWFYDGDKSCVRLFSTPTTWSTAQENCKKLNAQLVQTSDSKSAAILEDYFLKQVSPIWTGFRKNDSAVPDANTTLPAHPGSFSSSQFHVLDGKEDKWHPAPTDQGCVAMANYGELVGIAYAPGFAFSPCAHKNAYICQRVGQSMAPIGQSIEINPQKTIIPSVLGAIANLNYEVLSQTPNCHVGWFLDGRAQCVKIYYEQKTWEAAKEHCAGANAQLATMSDGSYDSLLRKELGDGVWIGYRLTPKDLWVNAAAKEYTLTTFTNFPTAIMNGSAAGHDQSMAGYKTYASDCQNCQKCAFLKDYGFLKSTPGLPVPFAPAWAATDCQTKKRFICQKAAYGEEGSGWYEGSGSTREGSFATPIAASYLLLLLPIVMH